jgi:hypothetical protein
LGWCSTILLSVPISLALERTSDTWAILNWVEQSDSREAGILTSYLGVMPQRAHTITF